MSVHTMNHALFATMPFDGVKDFSPITLLAYVTNTMVVHPSVPANTVAEFIAYAKANPGKVAYASSGPGSTNHLCAALLEKMAGIEMLHVPYRGGAPAVADTVGGQVQLFFTAGTQSLEHVKAGRLKLLAVTEAKRSPLLPDVPTVAETVPGYEMTVWYGAFGPPGMPKEIVAQAQRRDRPRAVPARGEEAHGRHRGRGRVVDAGGARRTHARAMPRNGAASSRASGSRRSRHARAHGTVIFDLGGVLIDWNPRHLYRKLFPGDEAAMERFLGEICTMEWHLQHDAGRPFAETCAELKLGIRVMMR